ncbi:MAG: hypothetical protein KME45_27390 [Stenomitos rutilans HA7619-LM2]|jgi:hypothetical protein|nr:hypothetical protein [Stenomitos rutilans HA7619-LM2]
MKWNLKDLQLTLVHIYEYTVAGKQHTAVLKPIDAGNGVILEETFDGSGIMRGLLVSGGTVHIPLEGITNYFQSWWRLFANDGHGGRRTIYTDDEERVGNEAVRDYGKRGSWDEDGCYTKAEETDKGSSDSRRNYPKDKRPDEYKD